MRLGPNNSCLPMHRTSAKYRKIEYVFDYRCNGCLRDKPSSSTARAAADSRLVVTASASIRTSSRTILFAPHHAFLQRVVISCVSQGSGHVRELPCSHMRTAAGRDSRPLRKTPACGTDIFWYYKNEWVQKRKRKISGCTNLLTDFDGHKVL